MSVINKIFSRKADEEVHSDFLKFGKGEYKDRYLIEAKKQKDRLAIKTGPEFANFFVRKCLEKENEKIDIKGVIITTLDLRNEINFEIKKIGNFQGIKKIEIETSVSPKEIIALMEKYPRIFFALSFKTKDCELKIKPKAPKSAKPGTKDEEARPDFCSLKTGNKEIIDDLFFDNKIFKEIKIRHTLKINDIDYPKNEKDAQKVRELSKRKGIIIREAEADGRKSTSEAEFFA